MTLKAKDMSAIALVNGFTAWHFYASDPIETVLSDGYFNYFLKLANNGDIIYITKDSDTYIRVMEIGGQTVKLKEAK